VVNTVNDEGEADPLARAQLRRSADRHAPIRVDLELLDGLAGEIAGVMAEQERELRAMFRTELDALRAEMADWRSRLGS
jgi:hypothetical protein